MPDPSVSGIPPIQPTPNPDAQPTLPAKEAGQQRPFTLGPEPLGAESGKATPMELAKDRSAQPPWSQEELHDKLETSKIQYEGYSARLKGPEGKKLTSDHLQALDKLEKKLSPDIKTIAEQTGGAFQPKSGESGLDSIISWLGSAQDTFGGALGYLETAPNMSPGDFLKLQYSVQRAAQRGELFASVIGSSVSGIKTLMSTQLG